MHLFTFRHLCTCSLTRWQLTAEHFDVQNAICHVSRMVFRRLQALQVAFTCAKSELEADAETHLLWRCPCIYFGPKFGLVAVAGWD